MSNVSHIKHRHKAQQSADKIHTNGMIQTPRVPVRLSVAEQGSLRGLPYFVRCLYVLAIRPYMDMVTGVVGLRSQISYGSLAADMHVEPHQGEQDSGTPTTSRIKRAVQRLIKAGLLVNQSISTPTYKRLVFFCPLADTDQSAQKKPGPFSDHSAKKPGPQAGPNNASIYGHLNGEPGPQAEPPFFSYAEKAGSHPDTGYLKEYDEANASSLSPASLGDDAPPGDQKSKTENLPSCPHDYLLGLWAKHFPAKPQPNTCSDRRKKAIRSVWRHCARLKHRETGQPLYTTQEEGKIWWDRFMGYVANIQFCMTKQKNFTVDWFFKASSVEKIMDGNYEDDK